jgi:hypothetical protein
MRTGRVRRLHTSRFLPDSVTRPQKRPSIPFPRTRSRLLRFHTRARLPGPSSEAASQLQVVGRQIGKAPPARAPHSVDGLRSATGAALPFLSPAKGNCRTGRGASPHSGIAMRKCLMISRVRRARGAGRCDPRDVDGHRLHGDSSWPID